MPRTLNGFVMGRFAATTMLPFLPKKVGFKLVPVTGMPEYGRIRVI